MQCKRCEQEVDELYAISAAGKRLKICEECIERLQEEGEITDAALDAMREMMGYRGSF
ncbi:MAG: hypothetical protein H6715_04935 [Myxococcales bacterium]|nr:hypothetical protein [Myxococcales bacterium]